MKTYEEADVKLHVFLISALKGNELSARPGALLRGEVRGT